MKRDTILTIAVVVLLIVNVGTLSYLIFTKPHHSPPPPPAPMDGRGPMMRPDELIRHTLHLTDDQDKKYAASIESHHATMMKLDSEFRATADRYFALLKTNAPATGMEDSLVAAMGKMQSAKAAATFRHFAEIKSFCTPDQAKQFDTLVPELLDILLRSGGRGPDAPPPPMNCEMPPPPPRHD